MEENPCHGCMYYRPIVLNSGDKTEEKTRFCSYILEEGHKRPCPFGAGCIVKRIGKPRRLRYDLI